MSFSKQDARYEAKPLDLSEYSAVDMMADLGLHRRVSLPLQGRATVIPPPPPDIHKRGPMLARIVERDAEIQTAWGSVFDPALVEGRDDGLGTGQMHRSGQNFIPDEVRQRSPTRLRRARSAEGSGIGGRFELGRRPGKAPHPRQLPEPFQALRKVRERSGARSPDELDPKGDILAELRVESKLRMAKYKSTRPVARIVSNHLAGNPPVAPRAPSRATSMLSFHSSRIIPSNPLVSQWGAGTKLATASAGYNYAKDLDAKKAGKAQTDPALQDRTLNKVNNAAPRDSRSLVAHIPHRLVPKIAYSSTPPTKPAAHPAPGTAGPTLPSRQIPFPDTTQFFPTIATGAWSGDKPFDVETGQKLTDVTNNIDNAPQVENDTTAPIKPVTIPSTIPSPALEQRLDIEKGSIDLPTIDDQGETLSDAVQSKEPLDEIFVMDSIEDSYVSSEFDQPPASDSSIFSTVRSTHDQESPYPGEDSEHMEEDDMSELINDLQIISEAVHELKAKYLDYEGFEATLTTRLSEIRRLQKDILSEIDAEEESMLKLKESINTLRVKRVAVAGALKDKEIEVEDGKEQADAAMEAEFKAMIDEHEALMKEHEESEAEGMAMPDIEEEEEVSSSADTMPDIEEEEEEEATNTEAEITPPDTEEKKSPAGKSFTENKGVEKEERINDNRIQQGANQLERTRTEKSNLGNDTDQEQIREPEATRTESERFKSEKIGMGGADSQQTLLTAETICKEVEKGCLVAKSGEREQEDSPLQEAIEFNPKPGKVEKDFKRESAGVDRMSALLPGGRTIKHSTTEVDNRKYTEQADEEHLETACVGRPEIQSKKDQFEKVRIEKECLDEDRREIARIEAENHRARAEKIRREEGELVREHLEKVRRQEERFKAERAEIRRVLQAELDEKTRLEARAERENQKAPFRERGETASLEKRTGSIRIEKRAVSNRFPEVEMGPVRQVVFEQRRLSVVPGPVIHPAASVLPDVTTEKPLFPYTLELDLKPMYGPHALRVDIGQSDRPQDAILKRCSEVLSSLNHKELSEMPDFQNFLDKCDKRHARRVAKAYGSPGNC